MVLVLVAVALGVLLIGWTVICFLSRSRGVAQSKVEDAMYQYLWLVGTWTLKLVSCGFLRVTPRNVNLLSHY